MKLLAGVGVCVSAGVLTGCSGSEDVPVLPPTRAIETSRTMAPTAHLFADRVDATLEVVVDRRLLDPERVRVQSAFDPYERVDDTPMTREDLGPYSRLRYVYALRCLTAECIPVRLESMLGEQEEGRGERRTFRFPPARVRYDDPDEGVIELRSVSWPPLTAVSRLNEAQSEAEFPFKLSPTPLPSVGYRLPPLLFAALLAVAGLLLLALPTRASFRWSRARRPAPVEEPAVEPTPLERARALVVWSCEHGDGDDRRRALATLAAALAAANGGHASTRAEALAWSSPPPPPEDALALARGPEVDDESE